MRVREVQEGDDIIDSRDVIERIRQLEDERDYIKDQLDEVEQTEPIDVEKKLKLEQELKDFDEDEDLGGQLRKLKKLESECENEGDWKYGMTLIADHYFEQHARNEAEELCDMKQASEWPLNCIDWERAARELQHDYSSVEFGETTYWYRS